VTIPIPNLDDRDFQTLVTDAKMRIAQTCPEWNEHNVSDPGVTLIEQFAYMTEQLIFRVNRIPERLHIALLNLLDIQLAPPEAARALVRFSLTDGANLPPTGLTLYAYSTEVATAAVGSDEPIVFRLDRDFSIKPVRPTDYGISRGPIEWVTVSDGHARPDGPSRAVFSDRPKEGDEFYLGFEDAIEKLVLRVSVEAAPAGGAGVDPLRPPWVWEASCADQSWQPVEVLEDTTSGLNRDGHIDLQLPQDSTPQTLGEQKDHRHWLRCRFAPGQAPPYTRSPRLTSITAWPIGVSLPAVRAEWHAEEEIGESEGTPAQVFRVAHAPALELDDDREYLEVRAPGEEKWVRWRRVDSFGKSDRDDRHFRFDPASGEIELGPRIREGDEWSQHGAVPPPGARLRLSAYRQGDLSGGNVGAGMLTVLRKGIPGIDSVTNPRPAEDGAGVEALDSARERAVLEFGSSRRAVTADDYAFLAGEASTNVARAHCMAPRDGRGVVVSILPRIALDDGTDERAEALRHLSREELTPDPELIRRVHRYLDRRRILGTSLHVEPARLREVTVVVQAVREPFAERTAVEEEVRRVLYRFLNPLIGGLDGEGWPFGAEVSLGELRALVQAVPEVMSVRLLRMYAHDRITGKREESDAGTRIELEPGEVACSGKHDVLCEAV
jgi:predicted phage baseplate assembly protein